MKTYILIPEGDKARSRLSKYLDTLMGDFENEPVVTSEVDLDSMPFGAAILPVAYETKREKNAKGKYENTFVGVSGNPVQTTSFLQGVGSFDRKRFLAALADETPKGHRCFITADDPNAKQRFLGKLRLYPV